MAGELAPQAQPKAVGDPVDHGEAGGEQEQQGVLNLRKRSQSGMAGEQDRDVGERAQGDQPEGDPEQALALLAKVGQGLPAAGAGAPAAPRAPRSRSALARRATARG